MASKGQKFRKWSFEEKLRIVKRHTEDHVSARQLAKEEGPTDSMICRWVRQYEEMAYSLRNEQGIRMQHCIQANRLQSLSSYGYWLSNKR